MSYSVELESRAKRELLDLPRAMHRRIADVLDDLSNNPRPNGSKKLTGQEGYRVRLGDYRVLYMIDDHSRRVRIYQIGHRREIYR